MNPAYSDPLVTVYEGDCLDVMRELPDASVDAVVTDPPYGLEFMGKDWDSLRSHIGNPNMQASKRMEHGEPEKGNPWASERSSHGAPRRNPWCRRCGKYRTAPHASKCHCKEPDWNTRQDEGGRQMQGWHEQWATEAFRVLKPGGYLLAFGGTRTYHRLASAIEDAGFEIRDTLMWIYASGFPKSLDVSKALDKVAGAEREVVGLHPAPAANKPGGASYHMSERGMPDEATITAPATDLARKWEGWGTALKPAHEPIVMARKPLVGTVAQNVTRYGTGALNIDGARIPADGETPKGSGNRNGEGTTYHLKDWVSQNGGNETPAAGRWPSNVLLSSPELFDEPNPGVVGSGATTTSGSRSGEYGMSGYMEGWGSKDAELSGDSGGYSRFFRVPQRESTPPPEHNHASFGCDESCPNFQHLLSMQGGGGNYPTAFIIPKADRAERERGLAGAPKQDGGAYANGKGMPGRTFKDGEWVQTGTWEEPNRTPRANVHPTVKPIDLMRHLVRLVTPPGGTVLDPFAGSGTTGLAASEEGFRSILIEREAEYVQIILGRLMATPMGLGLDVPIVGRRDIGKQRGNKDEEGRPTLEGPASLGSSWFHAKPDDEEPAA